MMQVWRPIKTAPKDRLILLAQPPHSKDYPWLIMQGRWIDLCHSNFIRHALSANKPIPEPPINPCWLGAYPAILQYGGLYEGFAYEECPIVLYPTHWCPLPSPPRPRKSKKH